MKASLAAAAALTVLYVLLRDYFRIVALIVSMLALPPALYSLAAILSLLAPFMHKLRSLAILAIYLDLLKRYKNPSENALLLASLALLIVNSLAGELAKALAIREIAGFTILFAFTAISLKPSLRKPLAVMLLRIPPTFAIVYYRQEIRNFLLTHPPDPIAIPLYPFIVIAFYLLVMISPRIFVSFTALLAITLVAEVEDTNESRLAASLVATIFILSLLGELSRVFELLLAIVAVLDFDSGYIKSKRFLSRLVSIVKKARFP